jgi:hypothetical protein
MISRIAQTGFLSPDDLHAAVAEAFASESLDGQRLLCIIADSTRSMPNIFPNTDQCRLHDNLPTNALSPAFDWHLLQNRRGVLCF